MKAINQCFDLWVNQRLSAANAHHWRIALRGRSEAIPKGQHIFQTGGVLTNATAPGTSQIAGMKRLQLKNRGELLHAADFIPHDVRGNFSSKRERETHVLEP